MKKFWIPVIFFMLSFYCLGAGIMDSLAIYHSWLFVGENEFATVHKAAGERIVPLLVFPMLVLTVFCVLMFRHRPEPVPKSIIWLAFAALLAGWLSSAFIQIPIQTQLSKGKDVALLHKLIVTDRIRIFALVIYISAVIKMLLCIRSAYQNKYNHKTIMGKAHASAPAL